jgi:hypothetical protein
VWNASHWKHTHILRLRTHESAIGSKRHLNQKRGTSELPVRRHHGITALSASVSWWLQAHTMILRRRRSHPAHKVSSTSVLWAADINCTEIDLLLLRRLIAQY